MSPRACHQSKWNCRYPPELSDCKRQSRKTSRTAQGEGLDAHHFGLGRGFHSYPWDFTPSPFWPTPSGNLQTTFIQATRRRSPRSARNAAGRRSPGGSSTPYAGPPTRCSSATPMISTLASTCTSVRVHFEDEEVPALKRKTWDGAAKT